MNSLITTYQEPFGFGKEVYYLKEGKSLQEISMMVPHLPDDFYEVGIICINNVPVPRNMWKSVKPKASNSKTHVPVQIDFRVPVYGGGGDGGKNVFALVASFALLAATGAAIGGFFQTAGGLFAAGSTSAYALGFGFALAGQLLVSALTAPPGGGQEENIRDQDRNSSANGNSLEPNGAVPRVVGTHKVFPPFAGEPLIYYDGPDEIVEVAYVLAGPHDIQDIKIGATPIEELTDVDFSIKEGWPGDSRVGTVSRQSRTETPQIELRRQVVSETDGRTIETITGDLQSANAQVSTVSTRSSPDEHWLQLVFPQGLNKNGSDSNDMRVPFRLRIRRIGESSWVYLPEIHFKGSIVAKIARATIRLHWVDNPNTTPSVASAEGFTEARTFSPAQSAPPVNQNWNADSYFYSGSGDTYVSPSNLGTTGIQHISMNKYSVDIFLDKTIFLPGRWEIEITRGAAFQNSSFNSSNYTVSGVVWDLFGFQGFPGLISESINAVADSVSLVRSISVWNEHPIPTDDFAIIAIKARNRSISELSCLASGYVRDWDGIGWNDWVTTSNPAPHFRSVGLTSARPIPLSMVDEDGLVSWRQACIDNGYEVNSIIEDASMSSSLQIIASAGYASPYHSEIWGVVRDYDRSAESPIQIFSPRNSNEFSWRKDFNFLPDGFRINFRDKNDDYNSRQVIVWRRGIPGPVLEQVDYPGLVTENEVIARATFDFAQSEKRSIFYTMNSAAESIVARRGDLVGVQHDSLSKMTGTARIQSWNVDGFSDVEKIILDDEIYLVNEPDFLSVSDLLAIEDFLMVGVKTGVLLRRDGSITIHEVSGSTGMTNELDFSPSIDAAGLYVGGLISTGPLQQETNRMIVFSVIPRSDLTAEITFVDEAKEIFA